MAPRSVSRDVNTGEREGDPNNSLYCTITTQSQRSTAFSPHDARFTSSALNFLSENNHISQIAYHLLWLAKKWTEGTRKKYFSCKNGRAGVSEKSICDRFGNFLVFCIEFWMGAIDVFAKGSRASVVGGFRSASRRSLLCCEQVGRGRRF